MGLLLMIGDTADIADLGRFEVSIAAIGFRLALIFSAAHNVVVRMLRLAGSWVQGPLIHPACY